MPTSCQAPGTAYSSSWSSTFPVAAPVGSPSFQARNVAAVADPRRWRQTLSSNARSRSSVDLNA